MAGTIRPLILKLPKGQWVSQVGNGYVELSLSSMYGGRELLCLPNITVRLKSFCRDVVDLVFAAAAVAFVTIILTLCRPQ